MKRATAVLKNVATMAMLAMAVLLPPRAVHAQAANANVLKFIPGLTATQKAIADAIDEACPDAVTTSGRDRNGNLAQRFSASCSILVSSRANSGVTNANAFDLDISANEIMTAMERYGGKENAGTGSLSSTAPGNGALLGRFVQLHQGATGFNLANSFINVDGRSVSLAQLAGKTGGAAGEDSVTGRGLGGFANLTYGTGDKDTTAQETGVDFTTWNLAVGADYRVNDNAVGGVALTYANVDSDFDLGLGDTKDKVISLSLYGTYYLKDSFYIDAHVGYGKHDFDTSRRIVVPTNNANPGLNATATSDGVGGDQISAFVGGGYTVTSGATMFTPYVNLAFLKLDIDQFSETENVGGMALAVSEQSVKSTQSALGVRVQHSISTASGVFVPSAHVAFHHEFSNKSRSVTARFINDPFGTTFAIPTANPDKNFFSLGVGASALFSKGVSGYLSYETVLGLSDVTNHTVSAGIRAEW